MTEPTQSNATDVPAPGSREVDPDRDHIRGNPNAPLTLVEYGDYGCPFGSRATGAIDEVRNYFGCADGIGLDIEKFDGALHSPKVLHRVQDDEQDAELMDLNSTPTFRVNGRRHQGPWDAASLIRALEAKG